MFATPSIVAAAAIKLLILADIRLYREGMSQSLSSRGQIAVVGAAASLDEAIAMVDERRPDVILVDIATRGSMAAIRALRERRPGTPIVGFGVDEVEGEVLACAEAGLAGYVPCDASLDDLVLRIQSVSKGELMCPPRIAASLFRRLETASTSAAQPPTALSLTSREREVLTLIDGGLSNKEIAGRLNIEISTVKNHVHNLLEKLQVTSRAQAAARLGTHVTTPDRSRSRS